MKIAVIEKPEISIESEELLARLAKRFDVARVRFGEEVPNEAQAVVVFGGDGSVLETVNMLEGRQVPILGVNFGNLGFLTQLDASNAELVVKALVDMKIEERMLFDVYLNGEFKGRALNDAVLKTQSARPVFLDLYIDGSYVDGYHADGVILSTPTGSTAYSLSAGGPVLAPTLDAVIINPICAHSLHSRPLVVSADSEIEILLQGENCACVSIDGRPVEFRACPSMSLQVKRSKELAKFVSARSDGFYKKLMHKMNVWGVTRHSS